MLIGETILLLLARQWRRLPVGVFHSALRKTWQRKGLGKLAKLLAALAGSMVVLRQLAQRYAAQKMHQMMDSKMQELNAIRDPTFGPGIVHDMDKPDTLHEAFLDSLHLEKNSPIQVHLCQLFRRPDIDEQLCRLYDQASAGSPRISREAFMRLSRGIYGNLHQLLKGRERMPLAACTPQDQQWIFRHFDHFFPPERPLDRKLFPGYFKLILLRRIVRSIVAHIGLPRLRRGTSAPLVLMVGVDLGDGHAPFRLNTVTPNAKTDLCGESLALIEEASQDVDPPSSQLAQAPRLLGFLGSVRQFASVAKMRACDLL